MSVCRWNNEEIDNIIIEELSQKIVFNSKQDNKIKFIKSAIEVSKVFNHATISRPLSTPIMLLSFIALIFSALIIKENIFLSSLIFFLSLVVLLFARKRTVNLPRLEGMNLKYLSKDKKLVTVTFEDDNLDDANTYTSLFQYVDLDKTIESLRGSSKILFTNVREINGNYIGNYKNQTYTFDYIPDVLLHEKSIKLTDVITVNLIHDYQKVTDPITILSYPLLHITLSNDY